MPQKTRYIAITLIAAALITGIILLVSFGMGKSKRPLSIEELAAEQTRIAAEVGLRQTSAASTREAGVYLTLGVPIPTGTPDIVSTDGGLGGRAFTATLAGSDSNPAAASTPVAQSGATARPQNTQAGQVSTTQAAQITPTRTFTLTPTKTATATRTFTATPQTGWGGEWTVYLAQPDGSYQSGPMTVTLNGYLVSASATVNGTLYALTGEILDQDRLVMGEWTTPATGGRFRWEVLTEYQFAGNINNQYGFCGARTGAQKPQNCAVILPDIR